MNKKWMALIGAGILAVLVAAGAAVLAMGPAPYPTGQVSFPAYSPEPGVVKPGELFYYEFSWEGIQAAEGLFEVKNDPQRPGFICAGADAKIVGQASLLYRGHDTVWACMNAANLKPDSYVLHIRESLDYYDMTITFNHQAQTANRFKVRKDGRKTARAFQTVNAYCPVSGYLLLRSLPWKVGDKRSFEIVDGDDRDLVVMEAVKLEKVVVPAGTFTAVRLQPSMFVLPDTRAEETAAYWEKQKRKDLERGRLVKSLTLWIATDPPRPIVKIRADVYFGHVDMDLARIAK